METNRKRRTKTRRAILLVLTVSMLCGCAHSKVAPKTENTAKVANEMESVYKQSGTFIIYRHIPTDTMYIKNGGICQIMNPETGLPLTYGEYAELAKRFHETNDTVVETAQ